ncbi:prepilin-type N-terminal cleavage/methylation domain-containing protein [Deferribacterales bacterium Es71-Z0220]|uniref:prepilin-type N-terminal cleavage/methylation domain-containing protein n=1 Tax=Deferrivibrio essentukiensis TaxID=2880922 RepID=UPI001F6079E2|nr:prepilin-type N-terminal cleavage/methylation domain-containing protein [Deferrivibrio essentukiensis]
MSRILDNIKYHRLHLSKCSAEKGFTLIEIIITILLLGIVASLGVGIISSVFTGYSDTVTKDYLYSESKFIIERIDRELRNTIPNTVRLHSSDTVLQFALFSDASYYERLADKNKIKLTESGFLNMGDNISIYNTKDIHFYDMSRVYQIMDNSTDNVTLDKKVQKYSPYNRFFVVDTPVTIFKSGNYIKRCFGYTIDISITGENVGTCNILGSYVESVKFAYDPGNRWRNAVVNIDLTLKRNDVSITQKHQVNIRNVP